MRDALDIGRNFPGVMCLPKEQPVGQMSCHRSVIWGYQAFDIRHLPKEQPARKKDLKTRV